jgi:hypothetical protein
MSSPSSVRIPSNVDMPDRVIGPLTARQLAILAVTGLVLYAGWAATRAFVPIPVFLILATPIGAAATALALGRRDGLSLDQLLLAAIRQRLAPRYQVAAPEGVLPAPTWLTAATHTTDGTENDRRRGERIAPAPLRLPAEAIEPASATDVGVLDLGRDGLAVVAVTSTVNFALRTAGEQEALVGSFARYLHSLTAPVQILIRTHRLDLSSAIVELRERAGGLPHPALESAALDHADYLAALGEQTELLRRQVLLVLREPIVSTSTDGVGGVLSAAAWRRSTRSHGHRESAGHAGVRQAAEFRLVRRLSEAVELLAPAGIVVTALSAGEATAVLATSCNPDTLLPPNGELAAADEVITTTCTSGGAPLDDTDAAAPAVVVDRDCRGRPGLARRRRRLCRPHRRLRGRGL